jgi:hypothetical protein
MSDLTLEDVRRMIDALFPVMLYHCDGNIKRGNVMRVKATENNPEWFIFHPLDFAEIRDELSRTHTLKDIKDHDFNAMDYIRPVKFNPFIEEPYYNKSGC